MAATPKPLVPPTHEVHEFSSTRKWIIAFSVMLGTVLEVLDSSIVNVSLPHMQGSFSASVDEIAWVVTSYLVAAGTSPSGSPETTASSPLRPHPASGGRKRSD